MANSMAARIDVVLTEDALIDVLMAVGGVVPSFV
jgi:hypothetical protein